MTGTLESPASSRSRVSEWLPTSVDRRLRVLVWMTLVVQTLIVATGGAVRLTGSGLGCPTWPLCTDSSLVNTPEMGIHGYVEFGNRLLSIIVGIVAVVLVLSLLRLRRERRDLFLPAVAILALTVLQGLIGGISVRVQLDPSVVGVHYLVSTVLVALSAALVYNALIGPREGVRRVPGWYAGLVHLTTLAVAVTLVVGVLTTGSGPHAGDAGAARNGLNPELLQHIHSWPAYITFGLTVLLLVLAAARGIDGPRRFVAGLLAVEVLQIVVGIAQSRMGLPVLLVGVHMVLACVLAAAMTWVVLSLKR